MKEQRVVMVTAGASGMGLGVCKCFAAGGHSVTMLDVQGEVLRRESTALLADGEKVIALKVDVASREQIDAAYATVRKQRGPISITAVLQLHLGSPTTRAPQARNIY